MTFSDWISTITLEGTLNFVLVCGLLLGLASAYRTVTEKLDEIVHELKKQRDDR